MQWEENLLLPNEFCWIVSSPMFWTRISKWETKPVFQAVQCPFNIELAASIHSQILHHEASFMEMLVSSTWLTEESVMINAVTGNTNDVLWWAFSNSLLGDPDTFRCWVTHCKPCLHVLVTGDKTFLTSQKI